MDDLAFKQNIVVEHVQVESLILKIQYFDPSGIAARDVQECLLIQLRRKILHSSQPAVKHALRIVEFHFDEFTKSDVTIKGIPVSVTESKITIILEELLSDIDLEVPDASFSHFDVMAKSFAKTLSIKTGTFLSEKEQENLVNSLFACKEPNVTPQGQVTFITMSVDDIDKKFK